ncbi:MAG: hypothetical protein IMX02_10010 [Limnochordaceae bacterium]|uniref:Uncharacterized protein n=1 Tax=Carboxydichorda subterranea TaxID=3109565 RepID=A0ABZ1BYI4_9FIRM|nr:hypothetical protein [Limnochorda sp. L945t]MBE3599096.1 hypothetical protein [Limnochordaceae bacterium]WRP17658.1 hypothetical protein U7230_01160 [Limnochorda sp. L945t]
MRMPIPPDVAALVSTLGWWMALASGLALVAGEFRPLLAAARRSLVAAGAWRSGTAGMASRSRRRLIALGVTAAGVAALWALLLTVSSPAAAGPAALLR